MKREENGIPEPWGKSPVIICRDTTAEVLTNFPQLTLSSLPSLSERIRLLCRGGFLQLPPPPLHPCWCSGYLHTARFLPAGARGCSQGACLALSRWPSGSPRTPGKDSTKLSSFCHHRLKHETWPTRVLFFPPFRPRKTFWAQVLNWFCRCGIWFYVRPSNKPCRLYLA